MLNNLLPKQTTSQHQRVSSDFFSGTIPKVQSIDESHKVTLVIFANPRQEKTFSVDMSANTKIKCGTKIFALNISHLRVESGFFSKIAEEMKDLKGTKEILLDNTKFKDQDVEILEKILRCLYGGKCEIQQGELYTAYIMCKELKIEKLLKLLNQDILKNFHQFNFFTLFQLAVTYKEIDILKRSQEYLEESEFEIVKDPSNQEKKNFPYPISFADLDQEAVRALLKYNTDFTFIEAREVCNLIVAYCKCNQFTSDQNALVKEFLPENKLKSNEYMYVLSCTQAQSDDSIHQSLRIQQNLDNSYHIQSQLIYYQKKVLEMEQQNQKLQQEMEKMKQEIESKTDEFNKKESQLLSKISTIESSVKQFEQLDKGKEQEYYKKMQKLFKMFKEYEAKYIEKEKQNQELYQVLKNFQFQNQYQGPPPDLASNNGQMNQPKANTTQGFFQRPSSLQNYPQDTMMDSHRMKSSDSSLMTTQNSIMYVTGGMQQSQLVPLSELESINQSNQFKQMFNKLPNLKTNNPKLNSSLLTRQANQNIMSPLQEKDESKKDPSLNAQKSSNDSKQTQQEPPVTQIHGFLDNDEDMESVIQSNFLTFNEQSKVLDECTLNYKSILQDFFELSPFKKMNLDLIFRSSRDKLSKKTFDEKVQGIAQTIVLIKSWEYDKIFGAYLSIPWSQNEQGYSQDEEAFLFSITENKKIPVKNSECALYQDEDHIFSFGTSDLSIFQDGDQDETNKSSYPHDYEEVKVEQNIPLNNLLAGNKVFQIDELEVYKINIEEEMDF